MIIKQVFPFKLGGFIRNIEQIKQNKLNMLVDSKLKTIIDRLHFDFLNAIYNNDDGFLKNKTHKALYKNIINNVNKDKDKEDYLFHSIFYNKRPKVENIIYIDKLVLHTNYVNKKESVIEEIIFNEKYDLCKILYKSKENKEVKNMKNVTVRMGIWIKSPYIFIKKDNDNKGNRNDLANKYKIYDEEWHHFVIQFNDNNENCFNTFSMFKPFSFVNVISRLLNLLMFRIKAEFPYDKMSICDYDFALKGNPLCNSKDNYNKNEYYYLKGIFESTPDEDENKEIMI